MWCDLARRSPLRSGSELGRGLEEVSERRHGVCPGEGVGHLVHQAEPGSDVSGGSRDAELGDGLREFPGWLDCGEADLKAGELDGVLGKHELLGVQGNAVGAAEGEPVGRVHECLRDVSRPHEGVIHAFGFVVDPLDMGTHRAWW